MGRIIIILALIYSVSLSGQGSGSIAFAPILVQDILDRMGVEYHPNPKNYYKGPAKPQVHVTFHPATGEIYRMYFSQQDSLHNVEPTGLPDYINIGYSKEYQFEGTNYKPKTRNVHKDKIFKPKE